MQPLRKSPHLLVFSILFWGSFSMTTGADLTAATTHENGRNCADASQRDFEGILSRGVVFYGDFGAVGDGKTDDMEAIAAAHAFANLHTLPVQADAGAAYYIGGEDRTAYIQTDTDFGAAEFIMDDRDVQNHRSHVFMVIPGSDAVEIQGVASLKRNQKKIDIALNGPSLVTVTDSTVMRHIRFGRNQNSGRPQTDIFVVDGNGNVDPETPIIWDFDQITSISAIPIDETTLTLTGGRFTTIANQAEASSPYYCRGLAIRRSNVVVEGLKHLVVGEGEQSAPYEGFLNIRECAHVTVRNTILTGRKTHWTIGSAGVPVPRGTYGVVVNRAHNVTFINCSQTNDINDPAYWGIMASNYCKNLVLDSCAFSRFDAHMGVVNATIRNSTIGHQGVNAIGRGILLIENSIINGRNLVLLRHDYGSTWEGELHIRNCVFRPAAGRTARAVLIGGANLGRHDFGYACHMPERIIMENLLIDDANHPEDCPGPAIFADFNPHMTDASHEEAFPYSITREVILRNVATASGRPLRLSDNLFMFRNVKVDSSRSIAEN